ncbi:hypothetical protein F53441_14145 [Fusarium austroafricanum]|uniref:DUF4385 domain-containing protein n=1 Tax=Fusarium austroafricanum TaxID=2364996 RepID=A0A8H4JJA8_9HYPO|nr:hypothetical protein F53441_14145 [Fusarium austroafricanum]
MPSPRSTAKPLMDTISEAHSMSYRIGRGEQGVLTFEPYKSAILPLWRFRTIPIAQKSAEDLWNKFNEFKDQNDFIGMDMTRKFIQMGMTRAKRYANHAGGRKYKKWTRDELPKSDVHPDKEEKDRASLIFRQYWERCKEDEEYQNLKKEFLQKQKSLKDS